MSETGVEVTVRCINVRAKNSVHYSSIENVRQSIMKSIFLFQAKMEAKYYDKLSGNSGRHGSTYECELILYYMLKAYESEEIFSLSHGNPDKLKWDDIVLESENYSIFAQAKHNADKSKEISLNDLSTNKYYKIDVYLVAFREYFQKLLKDIQKDLKKLENKIQEDNESSEGMKQELLSLCQLLEHFDEENTPIEVTIESLIDHLRNVSDEKNVQSLKSFQNVTLHLITNISPNEELDNSGLLISVDSDSLRIEENIQQYSIDGEEEFIEKLSNLNNISKIPKKFIELFLEKFLLVVIPDESLKENINQLLTTISKKFGISSENIYNFAFKIMENWYSNKKGIHLTRERVDAEYFAYFISHSFTKELKKNEDLIEFNIDPLLSSINDNLVTIVKTPRHHLILTMLHKEFVKKKFELILFVNPSLASEMQKLITNAFLHEKFTHFVCVLSKNNEQLMKLLKHIIEKIREIEKFIEYKRFILLCEPGVEIDNNIKNIVEDYEWFENRKLNLTRKPNSLKDMENFYVQRELSYDYGSEYYSEDDFLKRMVKNNTDLFVISDSPGMGKTSVLSSLSVKINKSDIYWAILIRLNRNTKLLKKHLIAKSVPRLEEFLETEVDNIFEKQICEVPNIIILMVDAFDEISPDYTEIVLNFLENTRASGKVKKIVVTSRTHLRSLLERKLQVEAFTLKLLSENEACSIISRLTEQSVDNVTKWYTTLPHTVRQFFRVPLHTTTFAESCGKLDAVLPTMDLNINLFDLYVEFVKRKEEIFINDKGNAEGNIFTENSLKEKFQKFLKTCNQVALQLFFHNETLDKLGITEIFTDPSEEEICIGGILQVSESSLEFVHETFKEYFVTKWALGEIFKDKPDLKTLEIIFREVLFYEDCYVVKEFIESYLFKNQKLITQEVLETFGNIASKLGFYRIKLSENIECYSNILKLIVEKCEKFLTISTIFEAMVDNEDAVVHTDLIILLIQKGANIRYRTHTGETLLHFAVAKGNFDLVKYIIDENLYNLDEENNDGETPLHLAILNNKNDILEILIEGGADVYKLNNLKFVRSPSIDPFKLIFKKCRNKLLDAHLGTLYLHLAAYKGTIDDVNYILTENMSDVHEKTLNGWNVLHSAVYGQNLNTIKHLITSLNVKTDDTTFEGETILHLAVSSGNLDLVKYILNLNLKIDAKMKDGKTPLDMAYSLKFENITKYILETYLKIENLEADSVAIALYIAVEKKYNTLFKSIYTKHTNNLAHLFTEGYGYYLIQDKKESNFDVLKYILSENLCKTNIVHFAARVGNLDIVKYFVNLKVKLNTMSVDGESVLHYAVHSGNLALVKYLIKSNVKIDAQTIKKETVLDISTYDKKSEKITMYLLEMFAKVNELDVSSVSNALLNAAKGGFCKLFENIFQKHKNKGAESLNGFDSLVEAINNNNIDLIKYIITVKLCSPYKEVNGGKNLLHYAAYGGNFDIIKYFVDLRVDINKMSSKGETVLHYAARNAKLESIKYLVNAGARIDEKTLKGESVLHLIVESRNIDSLKYLIDLGMKIDATTNDGRTALDIAYSIDPYMDATNYLLEIYEKSENLEFAAVSGALQIAAKLCQNNLFKSIYTKYKNKHSLTSRAIAYLEDAISHDNIDLIEYIFSDNICTKYGKTQTDETILHLAVFGGNIDTMEYLIALNLQIDEKNNDGKTALEIAYFYDDKYKVKYLLEMYTKYDDIDASSICNSLRIAANEGFNVLFKSIYNKHHTKIGRNHSYYYIGTAIIENNINLLQFILAENIWNKHKKTLDGMNILHFAAEYGNLCFVKYFISLGVTANEITHRGETILHLAVRSGNVNLVKYLIDLNFQLDAKTYNDETVLDVAYCLDYNEHVMKFLLEMFANRDDLEAVSVCNALRIAAVRGYNKLFQSIFIKHKCNPSLLSSGINYLLLVIEENNNDLVKYIVSENIYNLDGKTIDGMNILHFAALKGNVDIVKFLNSLNIRTDEKTYSGETISNLAVKSGNAELIKYCMDLNVISTKNGNGNTGLEMQSIGSNEDTIEFLETFIQLENPDITFIFNAIRVATKNGYNKLFKSIFEKHKNILTLSCNRYNYLYLVIEANNIDLVKYILSLNIYNLRKKTLDGMNILHFAAWKGNLDIVKHLITLKVKIDETTHSGETLLHIAVRNGNVDLIKYLGTINVKIYAKTDNGETALDIAHSLNNGGDVIKALLELYENLKSLDASSFFNALRVAARNDYNKLFESIFEKHKYNPLISSTGINYLLLVIEESNIHLVKYFLSENNNYIQQKTFDGMNILHYAAWKGNLDIVKHFVSLGVKIDEKTYFDETLLHLAVLNGKIDLVKYFIGLNVDTSAKTKDGETALDIADSLDIKRHVCKYEICELLAELDIP